MSPSPNKLLVAYENMMERVYTGFVELEHAEAEALPELRRRIATAADAAVHLGELTREEAGLVSAYVRRDVEDAGRYLASTGHELRDWLRFDLELVEERLLEWFGRAADRTRLAYLSFAADLERATHYQAGEISGPGTLRCENCGTEIALHGTSVILACASCQGTQYIRLSGPL